MVGYLGTQRDVHEMRDKMHDIQEQTRRLIRDANGAIKQLGEFDGGSQSETRERKMQQEKLSKDFKTVLQKFQTCYQVAISKERENVIQQRERAASFRDERSHYEPGVRPTVHCIAEEQGEEEEKSRRRTGRRMLYESKHRGSAK